MGVTIMLGKHAQREAALAKANHIRMARARLKDDVSSGRKTVAEVLADIPADAAGMPVLQLLACQTYWGKTRGRRRLKEAGVPEKATLGSLVRRQREMLADLPAAPASPRLIVASVITGGGAERLHLTETGRSTVCGHNSYDWRSVANTEWDAHPDLQCRRCLACPNWVLSA